MMSNERMIGFVTLCEVGIYYGRTKGQHIIDAIENSIGTNYFSNNVVEFDVEDYEVAKYASHDEMKEHNVKQTKETTLDT